MAGNPGRARPHRARAAEIRAAFDRHFWDDATQAYATCLAGGRFTAYRHSHVQLVALATGAVPDARRAAVTASLASGRLTRPELSVMPYLPRALMGVSAEARAFVRAEMEKHFCPMMEKGATRLWETEEGGDAFDLAGSLCHAWSSLPAYYLHACVLGVEPLAPGFKRFRVRPWADGRLHFADGEVATPAGPIRVRWRREPAGLRLAVEAPEGLEAVVESYPEQPVLAW